MAWNARKQILKKIVEAPKWGSQLQNGEVHTYTKKKIIENFILFWNLHGLKRKKTNFYPMQKNSRSSEMGQSAPKWGGPETF